MATLYLSGDAAGADFEQLPVVWLGLEEEHRVCIGVRICVCVAASVRARMMAQGAPPP